MDSGDFDEMIVVFGVGTIFIILFAFVVNAIHDFARVPAPRVTRK